MINLIPLINEICLIFSYPTEEVIEHYSLPNDLIELETEYTRLFINNFDENIISLYASTYINSLQCNEVLANLRKFYDLLNLKISSAERIDHLTIIAEFTGILIENNIEHKIFKNFISLYILCFEPIISEIKGKSKVPIYLLGAKNLDLFFSNLKAF